MIRYVAGALLVAVVALALARGAVLPVLAPDGDAPANIERLLPDAKQSLAGRLDLPLAYLRYLGAEIRKSDDLVILQFELRPLPYLTAEGAYLVSRCTPLDEIDPAGMGGGRGVTDFATDPELTYLRSGEQPAC